jgi:hypothetical protein
MTCTNNHFGLDWIVVPQIGDGILVFLIFLIFYHFRLNRTSERDENGKN